MEPALTEKILQLHRAGEMDALKQLVMTLLSEQYRHQGLIGLEAALQQADGRTSLKVMEFMLEDGGEDLVPFFLNRLKAERNLLYAKSILQLYSHFNHESALSELLSMERDLHPDMKNTYQRIVARFRSQFRENFYMSEFNSGNFKRMNNAMRMMINEPHPAYLPFLSEVLDSREPQKLTQALSVLKHQAEVHTAPALFRFTENLYQEILTSTLTLGHINVLKEESFNEIHFFRALAQMTMVHMTELRGKWIDARQAEKQDEAQQAFVAFCVDAYPIQIDTVRRAFAEWLKPVLKNNSFPSVETHRLQEVLNQYDLKYRPLVEKGLKVITALATREPQLEDRIHALQQLIPDADPAKKKMLLQAAKGFRTPRARDILTEYAKTTEDRDQLKEALEGLALCPQGDVFPRLTELALTGDPKQRDLRNAAFHVLASWGKADQLLDTLFKERDPEAQIDIVRLIGEDRLVVAKPTLLELLDKGAESDFLAAILTALSCFPGEDNIEHILPYLKETQYPSVRQAAMRSVLRAGGKQRFRTFVGQVQNASARFGAEMLEYLFRFLDDESVEHYAEDFYRQVDYWFELLDSSNEGWRKKLLSVLESLKWQKADLSVWILALEELLEHSEQHRTFNEKKRLETLRTQLETLRKDRLKYEKQHHRLHEILDLFEAGDHFEKVKAIRRLSTLFHPDMFVNNVSNKDRTLDMLRTFIEATTGDPNLVLVGVNAAIRIEDDTLKPVLEPLIEHENEDVANAARKALGLQKVEVRHIRKIFIVDDSRYITRQLSNVLDQAGYQVTAENHAASGLSKLAQASYDLLILDLNMPEMDGIALLDEARAQGQAPEHVIAIASNRDRDEIQAVVSRGVAGVLFKPFPMNELLSRIKNLETAHSET